jgi:predicted membrane protein
MLGNPSAARMHRPLPAWVIPLLGSAAGVLGVSLAMAANSPLRAAIYLCALAGGLLIFLAPFAGLYVFTAALIGVWPYQLIKIAGLAVCASALVWALAVRRPLVPRDRLFLIMVVLSGIAVISAVGAATDPANTIRYGGQTSEYVSSIFDVGDPRSTRAALAFVSNLVLFWTVATMACSAHVVKRLVQVMLISGIVVAMIGLVQFRLRFQWITSEANLIGGLPGVVGVTPEQAITVDGLFRIDSIAGAPDYLAMVMQILIPFAALWTARQTTQLRLVLGGVATGVLAVTLVLTLARTVLATTALILVPLLMARLGWRRTAPYVGLAAAAIGIALLAVEPFRERVISTVTELFNGDSGSITGSAGGWRREVLPLAFAMFRDYFWFGVGIGRHLTLFPIYLPEYLQLPQDFEFNHPIHNGYLVTAIELGVGGLGLMLSLIFGVWWRLRGLQAYFRSTRQRVLLDAALAAEIGWIVMAVDALNLPVLDGTFRYFFLLMALVGAMSRVRVDQQRVRPP